MLIFLNTFVVFFFSQADQNFCSLANYNGEEIKMPRKKHSVMEAVVVNCFEVMLKPCPSCKKKLKPEEAFEWLLVAAVREDSTLDPGEVNIVKAQEIRQSKNLTMKLANDGGKTRVHF